MPLYNIEHINTTTFGDSQEAIKTRDQARLALQDPTKLISNYAYKQQGKGNHGVYIFG